MAAWFPYLSSPPFHIFLPSLKGSTDLNQACIDLFSVQLKAFIVPAFNALLGHNSMHMPPLLLTLNKAKIDSWPLCPHVVIYLL